MRQAALPKNIEQTKIVTVRKAKETKHKTKMEKPSDAHHRLLNLILEKTAHVGVIGLGYVGLPLSMSFSKAGFPVTGFDSNTERVFKLLKGISYIPDVPQEDVHQYVHNEKFEPVMDFTKLKLCDVIVVCVPTPLSKTKDPDMSYIHMAIDQIADHLRTGQLIILESTTYPGTTREILLPRFAPKNMVCGKDYFLAFSPERVDPGNKTYNVFNTPKVVGGITSSCSDLAATFYSKVVERVVRVSSPESAEMVKLLENTFRSVNIGLVNEVAIMCQKLGIDCWEVIEAASTKPFGYMPFYPGPGLGGHCIPIDPSYLSWKLRSLNYTARFIELANAINSAMPGICVDLIMNTLNEEGKAVKGSKILILGIAYKKDIDDRRESPSLDIIHLLKSKGAEVDYYDPFVPSFEFDGTQLKSVSWSPNLGANYDCSVILTDHSQVDYRALLASSRKVVDTRNALKDFEDEKIRKL